MKLPASVKVGNYTFTVHAVPGHEMDKRQAAGQFSGYAQTIDLRTDMGDANLRDALLHEVLHGVLYAHGLARVLELDADGHEEKLVSALTPVILGVLRDNPALVKFLTAPGDLR